MKNLSAAKTSGASPTHGEKAIFIGLVFCIIGCRLELLLLLVLSFCVRTSSSNDNAVPIPIITRDIIMTVTFLVWAYILYGKRR